jgi:hypothetical protein
MYPNLLKIANFFFKFANEQYEKYREEMDRWAKMNPRPFNEWFNGKERVYIPFNKSYTEPNSDDQEIINLLSDHGWENIDYVNGIASKEIEQEFGGQKRSKIIKKKIAKILKEIFDKEKKQLQ